MKIRELLNIGQKLYRWRPGKIINYRWMPIFLFRCFIHKKEVDILEEHLSKTQIGKNFFYSHATIWFQLTRQNFYMNSTTKERLSYILDTWDFFAGLFSEADRNDIYCEQDKSLKLWEYKLDEEQNLVIDLNFIDGEIKEGCMTISLRLNGTSVYHVNFWISKKEELYSAYIGCCQGSRDGLDVNKELTKKLFGCRPQNFVFIALQELLACTEVTELFAVSSEGHYSNKFLSDKRKPKVSYNEFWTECGGKVCADKRFFTLPRHEKRKTMEEIPSKKRSTYRKRYELLDRLSAEIKQKVSGAIS